MFCIHLPLCGWKKEEEEEEEKEEEWWQFKELGFLFPATAGLLFPSGIFFFSLPLRLSLSLAPPQQHSPTWLPPSYPWLLPPFLLFLSRLLLSAHWFKSRAKPGGELVDAEPRLPAHHSPTLPPRPPRRLARK